MPFNRSRPCRAGILGLSATLMITLGAEAARAAPMPLQLGAPPLAGAGVGWQPDMKSAVKMATAQNKLVFVEVTASWCPACRKLDHDVMPKAEVSQFLSEKFVSVKIDRDSPAGGVLAKMFSLRGVPSLLIFDSRGQLLGKMAGAPRSAQDFKIMITNLIGGETVLGKYGPGTTAPAVHEPGEDSQRGDAKAFEQSGSADSDASEQPQATSPARTGGASTGWMPQTNEQSLQPAPQTGTSNPATDPQATRTAVPPQQSQPQIPLHMPPPQVPQQMPPQQQAQTLYPPAAQQASSYGSPPAQQPPVYGAPMAVPAWQQNLPPGAVPAWHPGLQAPMQYPPGGVAGWYQAPPVQMHPAAMPAMPAGWQPPVVPQWMPAQPGLVLPGAMPAPWPAYGAPYGYPVQYAAPQQPQ